MKDEILKIIEKAAGKKVELTDTLDELGLDSLDVVELAMNLEEEFSIDIDDDVLERINTVQDVIETVEGLK